MYRRPGLGLIALTGVSMAAMIGAAMGAAEEHMRLMPSRGAPGGAKIRRIKARHRPTSVLEMLPDPRLSRQQRRLLQRHYAKYKTIDRYRTQYENAVLDRYEGITPLP